MHSARNVPPAERWNPTSKMHARVGEWDGFKGPSREDYPYIHRSNFDSRLYKTIDGVFVFDLKKQKFHAVHPDYRAWRLADGSLHHQKLGEVPRIPGHRGAKSMIFYKGDTKNICLAVLDKATKKVLYLAKGWEFSMKPDGSPLLKGATREVPGKNNIVDSLRNSVFGALKVGIVNIESKVVAQSEPGWSMYEQSDGTWVGKKNLVFR
jgi:hypothetical protein